MVMIKTRPASQHKNSTGLRSPLANVHVTDKFWSDHEEEAVLQFGTARLLIEKGALVEAQDGLRIPAEAARQLLLPDLETLGRVVFNNRVIFGPLIGIFVSEKDIELLAQGQCKNHNFYKYVNECDRLGALACFFSLNNIFPGLRLVRGWFYKKQLAREGLWTSRLFPLPSVIYDRCFGAHGRSDGTKLREMLSELRQVTIFNAIPKLCKWETYQVLRQTPELASCLPRTAILYTNKQVAAAVNDCEAIYLKPDGLSRGHGVFRLSKVDDGFLLESRKPEQNVKRHLKNLHNIQSFLTSYGEAGGGYIIQEKIPLAKYRGKQFDMRVLCQKDINGKWIVAGTAVRVAARKSIITSPRSGGSVISWPHALKTVFRQKPGQHNGIAEKVTRIALIACQTIEDHFGCCGELGLDMGIDHKGKVWIIEVNAKPLKVSLSRLNDQHLDDEIYANPIRFACHLAVNG